MKRVGIRKFKEKATALIAEGESLVINKHGKPVGFYLPIKEKDKNDPKLDAAIARMDALMEEILAQTGMTEDELIDFFYQGLGTQRARCDSWLTPAPLLPNCCALEVEPACASHVLCFCIELDYNEVGLGYHLEAHLSLTKEI
jgi:antitoxin (DNA-binding transcriptional repressor) of toxin-antitoxin stability system